MSNIKIKFDSKKFERSLQKSINKIIDGENKKSRIKQIVSERGEEMKLLNDTEKELLKIILESDHDGYTYSGTINQFPDYIGIQIKKLFEILEECGYAAVAYCWLSGGWQITLTPQGVNYFEKEEEYKKMNNNSINIGTLYANGSNVNFGNIYDSSFNIDNSYMEIKKAIDDHAKEEDKSELNEILEELKDYVDNISSTKTVGKNSSLFKKIGKHLNTYQWFYQMILNFAGNAIISIMSGK